MNSVVKMEKLVLFLVGTELPHCKVDIFPSNIYCSIYYSYCPRILLNHHLFIFFPVLKRMEKSKTVFPRLSGSQDLSIIWAGGIAQAVEYLPSKHKALKNPSTAKKKKKKRNYLHTQDY
jgi:hypothetical protein